MLLKSLREEVLESNLELVRRGLVLYTFGNASGIDRQQGPGGNQAFGVEYDELRPEHMVITDLNGKIVEGTLRPSSDLDTHILLYREFARDRWSGPTLIPSSQRALPRPDCRSRHSVTRMRTISTALFR